METATIQPISRTKRPVFRFIVLLAGSFALFNVAFYGWIAESNLFGEYLTLNARASVPFIRVFDSGAAAEGNHVRSSRFSLEIKHGCDALQPTAFFVFAMLSSPVPVSLRRRMLPILIGTASLLLLNIIRIVTLFYAGMNFSQVIFETLHEDIWQAVFIFLPLIFWIGWALRVTRQPLESSHASP